MNVLSLRVVLVPPSLLQFLRDNAERLNIKEESIAANDTEVMFSFRLIENKVFEVKTTDPTKNEIILVGELGKPKHIDDILIDYENMLRDYYPQAQVEVIISTRRA